MLSHQDNESSIIATSRAAHKAFSSLDSNTKHSSFTSCQDSYNLFKKCSTSGEVEGFSCGNAVASYMRCALNGC
eukprot:scaffold15798_cov234-Alexandrium_tamarense.AAC.1